MNLTNVLTLLIGFLLLGGCSDETQDRDDLKLKAIYQQYYLDYDMQNKEIKSEVYFRTSSYGSYVKLSSTDKIQFKVSGDDVSIADAIFVELAFERKQVFYGSRNVPYYKRSLNLDNTIKKNFEWQWYDSETDQTIKNKTTLPTPEMVSISHDAINPLDTTKNEELKIILKEALTEKQRFSVTITNTLKNSSSLNYSFTAKDSVDKKTFIIKSSTMRTDSQSDETKRTETSTRRYGNLNVDVTTEEAIPVLTSGRQNYSVSISLSESEDSVNSAGKGGSISKTIRFPNKEIDIIF
ncbi:MAG: hypothetical protein HON90_06290 [Halobacteriovoraceae bacterium]|jgi:hypothetical protein|nr:hypothetical protein [Halobacteriovoraceae bacterium]